MNSIFLAALFGFLIGVVGALYDWSLLAIVLLSTLIGGSIGLLTHV